MPEHVLEHAPSHDAQTDDGGSCDHVDCSGFLPWPCAPPSRRDTNCALPAQQTSAVVSMLTGHRQSRADSQPCLWRGHLPSSSVARGTTRTSMIDAKADDARAISRVQCRVLRC